MHYNSDKIRSEKDLPAHLTDMVRVLKNRIQAQMLTGDFYALLVELNSFVAPSLQPFKFQEIIIDGFSHDHPLNFDDRSANLCLRFKNGKFTSIFQSGTSPLVFENCTLENLRAKYVPIRTHLENSTLQSLDLRNDNGNFGYFSANASKIGSLVDSDKDVSFIYLRKSELKSIWLTRVKLSNVKFIQVTFTDAPILISCEMQKSVHFIDCLFKDRGMDAIGDYRELKQLMQRNHDEAMAIEFSGLEAFCRHQIIIEKNSKNLDWLVSHSHNFINRFGLDVYRPLTLIGLQTVISFLVFLSLTKLDLVYATNKEFGVYLQTIALAFLSSLGPLRIFAKFESVTPTAFIGELAMWVFAITSSLLWFFLILGIRKRYKIS